MPKQYEAMRDKFKGEGLSDKAAKTKAAKIYNSGRKPGQKPVTGRSEMKMAKGGTAKKKPKLGGMAGKAEKGLMSRAEKLKAAERKAMGMKGGGAVMKKKTGPRGTAVMMKKTGRKK